MGLFDKFFKKITVRTTIIQKSDEELQKEYDNIRHTCSPRQLNRKRYGIAPEEIMFLEYASGHATDLSTFAKSFYYDYGLDYEKTVNFLLKDNYMRIGSSEESLVVNTILELKNFLKLKQLPVSGKKDDLIQRILTQTTDYDTYFSKRIFILTEKGQSIINEYEIDKINQQKKEIADIISYIKNNQLKKLCSLFDNDDTIIEYVNAINEYRNMSHDNDRTLAICVVSVMWQKSFKSGIATLKELGYEDITESEINTAFSSVHSLKNIANYKECGIKEYSISTCGDNRVCDKCSKHDGKKYLVSEAVLGKTMPPFCDNCRCCMLAEFDFDL